MKKEKIQKNAALINLLAPVGFRFSKNKLEIGENTGKIYGITRYSENVDYGWMEPLMNIPGTIASLSYTPLPEGECADVINANMNVLKRRLNNTTDELAKKTLKRAWDNSDKMLDDISGKGESVGAVATTVMTIAEDKEYLDMADSRLKGTMKRGRHRYRLLADLQKEGFKSISPCYNGDKDIDNVLDKMAPLRSIVGGFPFASSGFNDGSGYLFATLTDSSNSTSSNMILDIWKRNQSRSNSHMVIMGDSGCGKSTKIKDIELMEYATGTKIIAIDPEREQKNLCDNLKGKWVNAGGGSGRINPLQVRPIPKEEEDKTYPIWGDTQAEQVWKQNTKDDALPDLASYLLHLRAWFQMACPDITITQLDLLEMQLLATYRRFSMNWDTDYTGFDNTDYPILSDLLETIDESMKNISDFEKKDMLELRAYINNMVTGSLQFLWNGHTTIDFDAQFIVIDTYDLQDTPDYIKGAQYYNILTWTWYEASKNRNEKVMVVADEAHLMLDRRIPHALIFLKSSFKRGRKFEISFVVASHSVVDFLDESIKLYGQAVLNAADIKILMGTDGKNLEETVALYKLTEAEEETLAIKQRGLAIMIIGSMHMKVKFEIADYKWQYFGSAGGR